MVTKATAKAAMFSASEWQMLNMVPMVRMASPRAMMKNCW